MAPASVDMEVALKIEVPTDAEALPSSASFFTQIQASNKGIPTPRIKVSQQLSSKPHKAM
jgi:hypothetical protein